MVSRHRSHRAQRSCVKAIVYTAPSELEYLDVDEPEAVDGDIVVSVRAVGICGSELEGFASQSPFRVPPLIMGHEFAGVRLDTGEAVLANPIVSCGTCDLCRRGCQNICRQRAIIGIQRPGAFAERVAVPQRNLYPMPDGMSFTQAAIVEPLANAVHAFRVAQSHEPQPSRVGVIGAGTIGLLTAVAARALGASEVVIADLSEERLDVARAAGFPAAARALDDEFDLIFDCVGTGATRTASVDLLRPGGATVWVGLHAQQPGFDAQQLIRQEKRVLASFSYQDQDYERAIRMATDLAVPWVTTCPLREGVAVFRSLLIGPTPWVKTLLIP
jgi:2-desacetyl-2-hydroxyethyl bacteriochlorophyllide A dehydrogenase